MRLAVISAFAAGTQAAHAINTVKMAEGFASLGHDVTIICWRADTRARDALQTTYGLEHALDWDLLPRSGRGDWRFAAGVYRRVRRLRPGFVFARAFVAPALTARMGIPTALESHAHPGRAPLPLRLASRASRGPSLRTWVTIAPRLERNFRALGVPAEKLLVLPTGVNVERFQRPQTDTPSPYRGDWQHNVAYVGHLYDYKGIPTVLAAAREFADVCFHLIGGSPEDLARQRALSESLGLENVVFHGQRAQNELPPYLWHADALLLPPSGQHASAEWTSPVKLGEYLASGTPIVATGIPALRYWLEDGLVTFVTPDDAQALAAGITATLARNDRTAQAAAGLGKALGWSYANRARRILDHAQR